ncbi:hypothetical protein [Hydrocarboniphaga sp.]|uniref:hypothetical protein n=1 Tax=Hydrocarboniphaga sp. TaxID=2033016 RepID=UPI003452C5FC
MRHIESYVHQSRIGVLVEFEAETVVPFKSEGFIRLAKDVAMHIASECPADLAHLSEQPFIKDPDKTIGALLSQASNACSETVIITRFTRWSCDSAPSEETARQIKRGPSAGGEAVQLSVLPDPASAASPLQPGRG